MSTFIKYLLEGVVVALLLIPWIILLRMAGIPDEVWWALGGFTVGGGVGFFATLMWVGSGLGL
jgi:hypothetical protein